MPESTSIFLSVKTPCKFFFESNCDYFRWEGSKPEARLILDDLIVKDARGDTFWVRSLLHRLTVLPENGNSLNFEFAFETWLPGIVRYKFRMGLWLTVFNSSEVTEDRVFFRLHSVSTVTVAFLILNVLFFLVFWIAGIVLFKAACFIKSLSVVSPSNLLGSETVAIFILESLKFDSSRSFGKALYLKWLGWMKAWPYYDSTYHF